MVVSGGIGQPSSCESGSPPRCRCYSVRVAEWGECDSNVAGQCKGVLGFASYSSEDHVAVDEPQWVDLALDYGFVGPAQCWSASSTASTRCGWPSEIDAVDVATGGRRGAYVTADEPDGVLLTACATGGYRGAAVFADTPV